MLLVDERVGSRELLQSIRKRGIQAELGGKLDADFQWTGSGPDGQVLVGVERKSIQDLLGSMRDRRLVGQQLGRMVAAHDICYLVVEGIWRRGRETGLVEVRNGRWETARGRFHYSEVGRFLCSLEELAGLRLWRTADAEETVAALADWYSWWQKPYSEHKSLDAIYAPAPVVPNWNRRGGRARTFEVRQEATLLQKVCAQLPRIDSRAIEVATYFSSVRDLAEADVDRWTGIRGIGKRTAEQIVEAVGGLG